MRVRTYHHTDIPALLFIQRSAALADDTVYQENADFIARFSALDARSNAFVVTDDDDDLNTWGQAGTLEGIEGEIIGYTVIEVCRGENAIHLLCHGAVHPQHRRRHAGYSLLVCALNRAYMLAAELGFGALGIARTVYFEALLPVRDPSSPYLAEKCEMSLAHVPAPQGLHLYRREL
jgi:hypothetical protein